MQGSEYTSTPAEKDKHTGLYVTNVQYGERTLLTKEGETYTYTTRKLEMEAEK